MLSSISRIQLHSLEVLIQQGSFGRAADHLNISQPALSMQIQRLEELCGGALVQRSSRPLKLTPFGEQFLPLAQPILRRFEDLEDWLQDAQSTVSGPLRLAAIPTIAPYCLPTVLPAFHAQFPEVQLHVSELPTEQLLEALLQERLDVGLMALPVAHRLTHLKVLPLWNETLWVYHPPKQFEGSVPAEVLQAWPTYLLAEGHCLRDQALGLCDPQKSGQTSGLQYQSGSLETLMRLVDVQGGLTIVPDMARSYLTADQKSTQTSSIESPHAERQIVLVYPAKSHKKKRIESLRLALMDYLSHS